MRVQACDKCLTITNKLHDITIIIDGKETKLELCAGCKKELRTWMTPAHKLLGRKAFAPDTPAKKPKKPRKPKKATKKAEKPQVVVKEEHRLPPKGTPDQQPSLTPPPKPVIPKGRR